MSATAPIKVISRPQKVFDFSDEVAPQDAGEDKPLSRYTTLSAEEFATLQGEIFKIQAKLTAQETLSLEEEMKINIWFRERRGAAMSVVKEKPEKVKVSRAKAPAKPRTKSIKAQSEAAMKDLFADLF